MPYPGMDEKTTKWMDNCVIKVMPSVKGDNLTHEQRKSSAIAICRSTLKKMHGDTAKAQLVLDKDFIIQCNELIERE